MAKRLVDAGFKVVVFDRNRKKVEALSAQGAAMAPSARTLAMEAEVIMSCLSNDDAVKEVYGGDEGVILSATSGNVIIEMSTISPETSRQLWRMGTFANGSGKLTPRLTRASPLSPRRA